MIAPTMGATQKGQSCESAHPPTKSAGPVERAGLTEVFVTGMMTRWISVRQRPIAIGAKPAGAFPCVAPMMTNRNIMISTTSVMSAEREQALSTGRVLAIAIGREAMGRVEVGRAAG